MKRCALAVPAYNEAEGLRWCLKAISEAALPEMCVWTRWYVLDDCSIDGTGQVASDWAGSCSAIPLSVLRSNQRLGKSANLGALHTQLSSAAEVDIVVVVDADVVPTAEAVLKLLDALSSDEALAVVWGTDEKPDPMPGRRAAIFQMLAKQRHAEMVGGPRAYGRFFAYNVRLLRDFCWQVGSDDVQLADWVALHGNRYSSVWDATVRVQPAKGWRDFYLQTYRSRSARAAHLDSGVTQSAERRWKVLQIKAFMSAALGDPFGAFAYSVARLVAFGRHQLRPEVFEVATSPRSVSTKRSQS